MGDYNEKIKGRILGLLKERDVSVNQLAIGSGRSQTAVNNQLSDGVSDKGRAKLSLDLVMHVLTKFPDVSADWLLRGMEQQPTAAVPSVGDNSIANNHNTTVNDTEAMRFVMHQLEEKDRQLAEKDSQISRLLLIIEKQEVG